jgi:hypothetical protein
VTTAGIPRRFPNEFGGCLTSWVGGCLTSERIWRVSDVLETAGAALHVLRLPCLRLPDVSALSANSTGFRDGIRSYRRWQSTLCTVLLRAHDIAEPYAREGTYGSVGALGEQSPGATRPGTPTDEPDAQSGTSKRGLINSPGRAVPSDRDTCEKARHLLEGARGGVESIDLRRRVDAPDRG